VLFLCFLRERRPSWSYLFLFERRIDTGIPLFGPHVELGELFLKLIYLIVNLFVLIVHG
jgi:hypothetical protein